MKAAILSIGDELLIGKIVNTNAQYIAKKLNACGIRTCAEMTVSDDEEEIVSALDYLKPRVDVVICTGGLGVTADDKSKQVIAKYFNRHLEVNEQAREDVTAWYAGHGLPMPEIAAGFSQLPNDCAVLRNPVGIAAGAIVTGEELAIVLLPGPPAEMRPMMDAAAESLAEGMKLKYNTIYIKTFGIREADCFVKIKDLISKYSRSVLITTYCELLEVTVAVRYSSKVSKMTVDTVLCQLHERLGEYIYAEGSLSLQEVLASMLRVRNMRLAVAESLTGGEIASRIVAIPGVSGFFYEDIVCYDNQSKIARLGISPETLKTKGAVSDDTAYEMAAGLLERTGADLVIATTGIAGPDGGSAEKPVGTVYLAIGTKKAIHIYKNEFFGDRNEIRDAAVKTALFKAIGVLKN